MQNIASATRKVFLDNGIRTGAAVSWLTAGDLDLKSDIFRDNPRVPRSNSSFCFIANCFVYIQQLTMI